MTRVSSDNDHNNANLAYEYTQFFFEGINKTIDELSKKLTTVLGFCGVLLRFAADMPSNRNDLVVLKISVCILIVCSCISCGIGFLPKSVTGVISVDELLNTSWYYKSEDECRRYIAGAWSDAIEDLKKLRDYRKSCLLYALIGLMMAITLFGSSIILESSHCLMF